MADDDWEHRGQNGGAHPVRGTAQSLAFRPMPVREDFRNEHPDDRALPDRVRRDTSEDARRNDDAAYGRR